MRRRTLARICAPVAALLLAACSADGEDTSAPETAQADTAAPGTDQARLDAQLIAAAWDDDVPRARRLIARGADVNAEDETQQSAYLIATSEGHLRLLELTLRNGADVAATDSFDGTGLIRAAERGHWRIVDRLVRAGVEVDHVNNLGWTALHEAILLGDGSRRYVTTVRVLLAAGADATLPSERDGLTPVEHARAQGYDAITDLLTSAIRTDASRLRHEVTPGSSPVPAAFTQGSHARSHGRSED